jgi:hypothetical protein
MRLPLVNPRVNLMRVIPVTTSMGPCIGKRATLLCCAAPVERPLASVAKCPLGACFCSCAYLSNLLEIFMTVMIIFKRALLIVMLNMMGISLFFLGFFLLFGYSVRNNVFSVLVRIS